MTEEALSAIAQLGVGSVFALAAYALFMRLQDAQSQFIKYLIEQNNLIRSQNNALSEQNKLLSLALLSNNPDALRAYNSMQKNSSPITDLQSS